MRRSTLTVTALTAALVVVLGAPTAVWARAEVAVVGDAACCFDLGLRVTVSADDGHLRSALEFAGREVVSVTLGPADVVRWGVPFVTILTELQNARTDRFISSRGNATAR